ncbi:hypothetical protein [Pseudonocardia abyssalis]|uniref:hypothetical protein n=1 Tax=Pseudonocardia abyssalis TaxID=2792008 RepID=UPI001CEC879A|nr:hypothetical protein [Pseudonocardia abyssalis]
MVAVQVVGDETPEVYLLQLGERPWRRLSPMPATPVTVRSPTTTATASSSSSSSDNLRSTVVAGSAVPSVVTPDLPGGVLSRPPAVADVVGHPIPLTTP